MDYPGLWWRSKGTLETIYSLNSQVQEYIEYDPWADEERNRDQTDEIMDNYELGMLAWEEEEESDSDGGAKSESDFEPYGKELLENLEKILAIEEAE
jgi:hypothetical protein